MPRHKLDLSSGFKLCPKCKETKPLSEFHKSKHTLHGFQVYCKPCMGQRHDKWRRQNLKKMAADRARRAKANPDRYADYSLKQHYGIELGTYDKMFAAQNGQCAICKRTNTGKHRRFHVDHCHDTQVIRGLLCHHCNLGIGHFNHDQTILQSAIRYLTESR